jgi:response regulator RpfG family c-di-GMP phosphodiesterase
MIKLLLLSEHSLATNLERARLHELGVHVVAETESKAAVTALLRKRADILMINLDYLGLDGSTALCQQLRATEILSNIPIIVSGAQVAHEQQKHLEKSGANLVIEQPLPRQVLITKIKKLLQQETRSEERIEKFSYLQAALNDGVRTYPLTITNISTSGMLAEIAENLPSGKECHIAITLAKATHPLQIVGKTIRMREHAAATSKNGSFSIGIKFVSFVGDAKKKLQDYLEKVGEEKNNMQFYL